MRLHKVLVCISLASLLSGCANAPLSERALRKRIVVAHNHDRSADFAPMRTWAWLPGLKLAVDDARIDRPLLEKRLRDAIGEELQTKGFKRKLAGKVDFFVAYDASLSEKLDLAPGRRAYSPSESWGVDPPAAGAPRVVGTYDAGTLIVDIVEPVSMKLLWRGSAQTGLELKRDSERVKIERIHRVAGAILETFPPRRGARTQTTP